MPRKAIKACPGRGRALSLALSPSLTQRAAMPSLFLHRISVVRVYLYIAATTPDPVGLDPRQVVMFYFTIMSVCPNAAVYTHLKN